MAGSSPSAAERFLRERLRALRKQAGFTQEGVAELAGISPVYYQSIEAGRRTNVSVRVIGELAGAYDLTISELFSSKVSPRRTARRPRPPPHRLKRNELPATKWR